MLIWLNLSNFHGNQLFLKQTTPKFYQCTHCMQLDTAHVIGPEQFLSTKHAPPLAMLSGHQPDFSSQISSPSLTINLPYVLRLKAQEGSENLTAVYSNSGLFLPRRQNIFTAID